MTSCRGPVCHEESLVVLYHILFDNEYEAYNFSSRMCGVENILALIM